MPTTPTASSGLCPCRPPARLPPLLAHLPSPKGKGKLPPPELYARTWTSIPHSIIARGPGWYMTHEELIQVMEFKLAFGENRPMLMGMIKALPVALVEEVTAKAFKVVAKVPTGSTPNSTDEVEGLIMEAMETLSKPLRGVGPATASLVLSLISPHIPFYSDQVGVQAFNLGGGGVKALKYDMKHYRLFLKYCTEQASAGAREFERRMWVEARGKELGLDLDGEEEETKVDITDEAETANEGLAKQAVDTVSKSTSRQKRSGGDKVDDSAAHGTSRPTRKKAKQ